MEWVVFFFWLMLGFFFWVGGLGEREGFVLLFGFSLCGFSVCFLLVFVFLLG